MDSIMLPRFPFTIIVEKGKRNYSTYSPDLPGCVATGSTIEETLINMAEAIAFHMEGMREVEKQSAERNRG